MKAWKAKQKALADIFGDWELSYQLLPRFFEALKEANPGTVVQFVNYPTDDPNVVIFGRVFWAFGASIKGFPHCRPIITIDGTHLYGKYKGVLMIAMGVDANDQLYPLAFAIVEKETTDTWSWFLACIRCLVTQRTGLCVISDRHKGIMKAMNENGTGWEEPFAYHRFSKINELNVQARADLDTLPLSKWSMCHGGALRYGIKTTNLAEVFNNVLKGARFLPITALVKVTFFRVNSYFVQRREFAKARIMEGLKFSPVVTKYVENNFEKAAHHKVEPFNSETGVYQVKTGRGQRTAGKGGHRHTVNLSKRTCTCNKFRSTISHVLMLFSCDL
ncbi:uncharacterized protein LOC141648705 [Silene latifolia]|uniref:uncharacterized protein LOC141648705 n=1 Tax=Silene latifolia TaxID=37657 RepID=UPI003D7729E0